MHAILLMSVYFKPCLLLGHLPPLLAACSWDSLGNISVPCSVYLVISVGQRLDKQRPNESVDEHIASVF